MFLASLLSPPRDLRFLGDFLPRFALAASLAALAGCSSYENPIYEVGDRRLLLVPFRDLASKNQSGFGESIRGRKVVDAFRSWTERNWGLNLCEGRDAENVVRVLREWTKPKLTVNDWKVLLAGIDTDLVLVGEIHEVRYHDPKTIGMFKGRIKGKYSLVDARTGRTAYQSTEIALEYPKLTELDVPLPDFGTDPEDIERGLVREFGERIGKDLFGYYSEH